MIHHNLWLYTALLWLCNKNNMIILWVNKSSLGQLPLLVIAGLLYSEKTGTQQRTYRTRRPIHRAHIWHLIHSAWVSRGSTVHLNRRARELFEWECLCECKFMCLCAIVHQHQKCPSGWVGGWGGTYCKYINCSVVFNQSIPWYFLGDPSLLAGIALAIMDVVRRFKISNNTASCDWFIRPDVFLQQISLQCL